MMRMMHVVVVPSSESPVWALNDLAPYTDAICREEIASCTRWSHLYLRCSKWTRQWMDSTRDCYVSLHWATMKMPLHHMNRITRRCPITIDNHNTLHNLFTSMHVPWTQNIAVYHIVSQDHVISHQHHAYSIMSRHNMSFYLCRSDILHSDSQTRTWFRQVTKALHESDAVYIHHITLCHVVLCHTLRNSTLRQWKIGNV